MPGPGGGPRGGGGHGGPGRSPVGEFGGPGRGSGGFGRSGRGPGGFGDRPPMRLHMPPPRPYRRWGGHYRPGCFGCCIAVLLPALLAMLIAV